MPRAVGVVDRAKEEYVQRILRRVAVLLATVAALIVAAGAYALTPGATGKVCGAKKCKTLTSALAKALGQRHGAYRTAKAPKPARYYLIVIKSHREGFISSKIIWVPSRKLWFDRQYLTPPISGYWRTDQKSLRSKLTAFVRHLKPYPAPAKWSRVLPK
jgi:hypothetical protein